MNIQLQLTAWVGAEVVTKMRVVNQKKVFWVKSKSVYLQKVLWFFRATDQHFYGGGKLHPSSWGQHIERIVEHLGSHQFPLTNSLQSSESNVQ